MIVVIVVRLCERSASLIDAVHRICIRTHGSDDICGIDARGGAVVGNMIRGVGVGLRIWPRLALGCLIWVVVPDVLRLDLRSLWCDWSGIQWRLI
jgi:hypothetical protein